MMVLSPAAMTAESPKLRDEKRGVEVATQYPDEELVAQGWQPRRNREEGARRCFEE
jgi:hypothetical protein